MAFDAKLAAAKWKAGVQGSSEKFKAGVARPKRDPIQAALAHEDKMLANFQESVTSGRWRDNLSAVSMSQWQQAMIARGLPAMLNNLAEKAKAQEEFGRRWGPYLDQIKDELANMPTNTVADKMAKIQRNMEHAMAAKGRFRRGRNG